MEELKKSVTTASGRSSILKGATFVRGFTVKPDELLSLIYDTEQHAPFPKDAVFKGFGCHSAGVDSIVELYYTSVSAPDQVCFAEKPEAFLRRIIQLSHGFIPLDSELDGIELSNRWTIVLLRIKSSHWPPAMKDDFLPLAHLRYAFGRLILTDISRAVENEKRITIQ
jgi:hypothetical protein